MSDQKTVDGQLEIPEGDAQGEGGPRIIAVEEPGPTRLTNAVTPSSDDDDDNDDAVPGTPSDPDVSNEPENVPPGEGDDGEPGEDTPVEIQL